MRRTRRTALAALALPLALLAAPGRSAEPRPIQTPGQTPAATPSPEPPKLEEKTSTTRQAITLGGRELRYTATAGTLVLKDDDGKPKASIFYVAYVKDGEPDPARRPVTYAFNGGPGSSSVWLHLGAFGPRRVAM